MRSTRGHRKSFRIFQPCFDLKEFLECLGKQKKNRKGIKEKSKNGENFIVDRNLVGRVRQKVSWKVHVFY